MKEQLKEQLSSSLSDFISNTLIKRESTPAAASNPAADAPVTPPPPAAPAPAPAAAATASGNAGGAIISSELPHDLLAEKSLLGCILMDNSCYNEISSLMLKKDDLFHPQHRVIFEGIIDLLHNNRMADYITVCSRIRDIGKLSLLGTDDMRARQFLVDLVEEQASSANVYHYAKIVKDKSILRNIIRTANKVASEAITYSGDCREFVSEVESRFFKITQDIRTGGIKKLSSCLHENLMEIDNAKNNPGELSGLSTGLDILDSLLLGMQPGQLLIVAARPGIGKTTLALNIALNCVKKSGLPSVFFSLEMMASEISLRILSSVSRVNYKKLRSKDIDERELNRLGEHVQKLNEHPIFISDDGHVTILDIQSECRKIKAEYGLGLVVVDYVQLLRSHSGNPSREQQISEISRGLKMMAKELGCPVIGLSQLNRGVESRVDKRPVVSDLRESGSLEQDADVVMLIYRDEYYNPSTTKEKGIAELIVGKNRSGETGVIRVAFKGEYATFANLTHDPLADLVTKNGKSNDNDEYGEDENILQHGQGQGQGQWQGQNGNGHNRMGSHFQFDSNS
ncbi:MAG: replicative DNA helicase [Oligoflexia bacterium]|nr:replicative DNA helicase [Oligoflexia bacterium]